MNRRVQAPSQFSGAVSLLRDCVGASEGQRVLIVREPGNANYYDHEAPQITAAAGRELGLTIYETVSETFIADENDKFKFADTLSGFDHVVFFSRIGDQIRFSSELNIPSSTMCYTLNEETLNSNFGTACYHGMSEIKQAIDEAVLSASCIHVTCPRGTDYRGKPNWDFVLESEVSLKRFPLLVPRPTPANGMSGTVALSQFLTATGSRHYEPFSLELPMGVLAHIDNNRIVEFEGDPSEVERINSHYRNISGQFSIDPWFVDSWHAGIHPGCHFTTAAKNDIVRWSGTAFGNPRVLHFHTCGDYAPGEICWHVLDPTITLDGVSLWDAGRLYPDRLPEGSAILKRHPHLARLFDNPERCLGLEE